MANDPRKKICYPMVILDCPPLELLVRELPPVPVSIGNVDYSDAGIPLLEELFKRVSKDHAEVMDDIRALLKKLTPTQRRKFERIIFNVQQSALLAGQKYEYDSQSLDHGMKRSGKRPRTEQKRALIREHLLKMKGYTEEERIAELFFEYQKGRKLSKEWEQRFGEDFPSHSTIRGAVNPKKLKFDSVSAYGMVISILDSDPTE